MLRWYAIIRMIWSYRLIHDLIWPPELVLVRYGTDSDILRGSIVERQFNSE